MEDLGLLAFCCKQTWPCLFWWVFIILGGKYHSFLQSAKVILMAQWLRHYAANLQVVCSNPVHECLWNVSVRSCYQSYVSDTTAAKTKPTNQLLGSTAVLLWHSLIRPVLKLIMQHYSWNKLNLCLMFCWKITGIDFNGIKKNIWTACYMSSAWWYVIDGHVTLM